MVQAHPPFNQTTLNAALKGKKKRKKLSPGAKLGEILLMQLLLLLPLLG